MEHLFSPCTRLHDTVESQGGLDRVRGLQELNLNVSTEEILSAERAFTFADLHNMLLGNGNTITWLTPHAAVARRDGIVVDDWLQLNESYCFSFNADGKVLSAFARSPEHLLEICNVVVRLLAVSVVQSVIMDNNWSSFEGLLDIQQTRPIPYRAKVLGRALLAVRTDPNRFWMLLSGNAEVAFPSSTTTTTPAASLPTPATVGACANAATAAAANHVTIDHPAANVAALASGQKRMGCP
jgi:hypothetical protein